MNYNSKSNEDKEGGKGEEVEDGKYDNLKYFSICSEYIHRRRESK